MVGVPGRSKGCSTCRKRKKRCDLNQPSCGNCRVGNFVCGGYQRDIIVVRVNGQDGKGQYRPQPSQSHQLIIARESSPADIRARNLNRTAVEIERFDAFWNLYLPKHVQSIWASEKSRQGRRAVQHWAEWIQSMTPGSEVLRCCLLSLSVTKVGHTNKDPAMVQQGMELYGKSLSSVAQRLCNPSNINQLEMIAACRLLVLWELFNGSTAAPYNWLGHINGLVQLIHLQPPQSYTKPGYHELFLESRYNGMVAAIGYRKTSFLSSPEWLTEPWRTYPKTQIDTIGDILISIPEILEEFDLLCSAPHTPTIEKRADQLKSKCWRFDEKLRKWKESYIRLISARPLHQQVQNIHVSMDAAPEDDLPDIIIAYGLAPLQCMALYWAACALHYETMRSLFELFPSVNLGEVEELKAPRMDGKVYCVCVVRSARYFLHPDTGLISTLAIGFPLGCIAQAICTRNLCFDSFAEESEWFRRVVNGKHSESGSAWMRAYLDKILDMKWHSDENERKHQRSTAPAYTHDYAISDAHNTNSARSMNDRTEDLCQYPFLYMEAVNERGPTAEQPPLIGECITQ